MWRHLPVEMVVVAVARRSHSQFLHYAQPDDDSADLIIFTVDIIHSIYYSANLVFITVPFIRYTGILFILKPTEIK